MAEVERLSQLPTLSLLNPIAFDCENIGKKILTLTDLRVPADVFFESTARHKTHQNENAKRRIPSFNNTADTQSAIRCNRSTRTLLRISTVTRSDNSHKKMIASSHRPPTSSRLLPRESSSEKLDLPTQTLQRRLTGDDGDISIAVKQTATVMKERDAFPFRLFEMLCQASLKTNEAGCPFDHIVDWESNGRSFVVHDEHQLMTTILPQ